MRWFTGIKQIVTSSIFSTRLHVKSNPSNTIVLDSIVFGSQIRWNRRKKINIGFEIIVFGQILPHKIGVSDLRSPNSQIQFRYTPNTMPIKDGLSDEETEHQYSKMILRSRKKSVRDLPGGKTLVSSAANKLEGPALEIINDEIYTEGLEKKVVLSVRPKSKVSITFNFSGPIISEYNEWLESESVRVNTVAALSVPRLIGRKVLHVGDAETKL